MMADSSSSTRSGLTGQVLTSSSSTTDAVDERKTQNAQPRVRRRNRIINSCLECRRRKLRCNKGQPCANCVKSSRQCHFISPSFDAAAQARLAEVKEKMGILERSLEEEVAQRNRTQASSLSPQKSDAVSMEEKPSSEEEEQEDIKDLKSSAYATFDSAYYEDEEGDDDIVDLGIALGKVRITERIGGMVRPRFTDEVSCFMLPLWFG